MRIKDFESLVQEKTEEEYRDWFEQIAKNEIYIGGVYIRCFKLSGTRVAFCDGSIYKVQPGNTLREFNSESDNLKQRMIRLYDSLDVMNRLAIREYLNLIQRKEEIEKAVRGLESIPEGDIYCSFCGKSKEEVLKLVAAEHKNVFICDECIDLCAELLDEDEKQSSSDMLQ